MAVRKVLKLFWQIIRYEQEFFIMIATSVSMCIVKRLPAKAFSDWLKLAVTGFYKS